MLRFIVDDPDALFAEYREQGVFHARTELGDKLGELGSLLSST